MGSSLAIAAKIQRQYRRPQIDRSGMDLGRSRGSGTYKTYKTGFDGFVGALPTESAEIRACGFQSRHPPRFTETVSLGKFPNR